MQTPLINIERVERGGTGYVLTGSMSRGSSRAIFALREPVEIANLVLTFSGALGILVGL